MADRDEYLAYLAHADDIADRRPGITATYLAVNTALIGIITFLMLDNQLAEWGKKVAIFGLLVAGIITCAFWRELILQYQQVLNWWYHRIREIETELPDSSRLISREYHDLYEPHNGKIHIGMARFELFLTWLFTVIYAAFCLVTVILLIWFP